MKGWGWWAIIFSFLLGFARRAKKKKDEEKNKFISLRGDIEEGWCKGRVGVSWKSIQKARELDWPTWNRQEKRKKTWIGKTEKKTSFFFLVAAFRPSPLSKRKKKKKRKKRPKSTETEAETRHPTSLRDSIWQRKTRTRRRGGCFLCFLPLPLLPRSTRQHNEKKCAPAAFRPSSLSRAPPPKKKKGRTRSPLLSPTPAASFQKKKPPRMISPLGTSPNERETRREKNKKKKKKETERETESFFFSK